MSIYGKGAKAKATRLHSEIVRAKGYCERCHRDPPLHAAHIIRRTYSWTRTDERNGWSLCPRCHFHLDSNPDEFMCFVAETIGMDLFHELKQKALDGVRKKFDWDQEVVRLEGIRDSV